MQADKRGERIQILQVVQGNSFKLWSCEETFGPFLA